MELVRSDCIICKPGREEGAQELEERVLSVFLELRLEDGIMPMGLLEKHLGLGTSSRLSEILNGMAEQGLIRIVYGEGYELGVSLVSQQV